MISSEGVRSEDRIGSDSWPRWSSVAAGTSTKCWPQEENDKDEEWEDVELSFYFINMIFIINYRYQNLDKSPILVQIWS